MKTTLFRMAKVGWIMVVCVGLLSGCIASQHGQPLPSDAYGSEVFVERQPKDNRELNTVITEQLRSRGFTASTGERGDAPDSAKYLVSYIDQWYWDMRMYLRNLKIEVRDPATNYIIGYGQSEQSSLSAMGDSFEDIINKALDEMLSTPSGE